MLRVSIRKRERIKEVGDINLRLSRHKRFVRVVAVDVLSLGMLVDDNLVSSDRVLHSEEGNILLNVSSDASFFEACVWQGDRIRSLESRDVLRESVREERLDRLTSGWDDKIILMDSGCFHE